MSKLEEHLVPFTAALDLEETKPGYSENGWGSFYEGDGHRPVQKYGDGYERRRREFEANMVYCRDPEWAIKILESTKGYEGLSVLEQMVLLGKIKERKIRNDTAADVKKASTKEEKMRILEEFHKEAKCERKITALKLDCMKEVREIRARELQKRRCECER